VAAIASGKIQAAALSPPATLQAKAKLRGCSDMSKLEAEYHINGVVTTRRYSKTNEDTVRRFYARLHRRAARAQKGRPSQSSRWEEFSH
jgi:ABC-type nitrate/sulfonate/bicarbonate transport system substrate-binding protein